MQSSSNPPTVPQLPPNPFHSAYESYKSQPLVTKFLLTCAITTYLSSWFFVDVTPFLSSSVSNTLIHYQIYRLVLSPLVCTSLLSLIFSFMKLGGSGNSSGNGRRLEHHIGSTNYMTLLIALTVVGNVIHLVLCIMLSRGLMGTLAGETNANGDVITKGTQGGEIDNEGEEDDIMTSSQLWLLNPSVGIWNIVLVLTSAECARASSHAKTPFFVLSIPTRFYPILLLFINGLSLSHVISAALGYALGKDKIEWIKLSYERRKWLEGDYGNGNGSSGMNGGSWGAGVLKKFTTLDGFVSGPSSAGNWIILGPNEGNSGEEGNDSSSSGSAINATSSQRFGFMGQSQPQPQQNDQGGGWTPTVFRRPDNDGKSSMASSTNMTSSSRPGGGGHRLGTATRRSNASPLMESTTGGNEQSKKVNREALLAAAERRRNHDIEKGEK